MSEITYKKILDTMKNQFYESCGKSAEVIGDIGIRFQTVASELFSLYCYGDFILKQAFAQTATGKCLDYHGELRNIKRKNASKAKGKVIFYINEPSQSDIEIKKGIICSLSSRPYIEFETIADVVLKAGETQVEAEATALEAGSAYNIQANEIDTMVNPPAYIVGVRNENEFIGGNDTENDYSLRKRIISAYALPATGVSLESIMQPILQLDEILDCTVYMEDDVYMEVYVRTVSGELDEELMEKVRNTVLISYIINYAVEVWQAQADACPIILSAKCKQDCEKTRENIISVLKEYFAAMKIGENLNLNKLVYEISRTDNVEYCEIGSQRAVNNTVICDQNKYLTLGDFEVLVYE